MSWRKMEMKCLYHGDGEDKLELQFKQFSTKIKVTVVMMTMRATRVLTYPLVKGCVRNRVTLVYVIYHTRTQGLYKECTTLHMGVSVAPNNLNHTTVSSVTYLHTMYDTWFIYTHISVFLFVFMDRPWFMPVACVACTHQKYYSPE